MSKTFCMRIIVSSFIALVFITGFSACKKDSGSTSDNSLASLDAAGKQPYGVAQMIQLL